MVSPPPNPPPNPPRAGYPAPKFPNPAPKGKPAPKNCELTPIMKILEKLRLQCFLHVARRIPNNKMERALKFAIRSFSEVYEIRA